MVALHRNPILKIVPMSRFEVSRVFDGFDVDFPQLSSDQ
jgi:hypothetical protein